MGVYRRPAERRGVSYLTALPERSVTLPGTRSPMTGSDRRAWADHELALRSGRDWERRVTDRFREVIDDVEFPDRWPANDRLILDEAGTLWVRRPPAVDAATAAWDVLRADGTQRGTVALPAALDVHAVVNDRVYGVMKGEWDEDLVKTFVVRWGRS